MGVLRRFLGALLLGVVVLIATGFATGRLASVVTNGVSMQPTFSAGDLVVVIRADHYDTGDVVAYRDGDRGEVVLHRIVGGDRGGYELRGDSNSSVDVVTPTADEVIGRQALHLPEIGRWIGSPLAMALAAGVLIGIAGLLTLGRSGRPVVIATDPDQRTEPSRAGQGRWRWWHALLIVADGAVVAGLTTAFLVPPTVVPPDPVPMHIGALSYGVEVAESDAYPDGRIDTGDTAFLRIVDHVDVTFRYEGVAGVPASARLRLVIDAAAGWTTAIPLTSLTPVVAGGVVLRGTIDMVDLREMLARVQGETGVTLTTVQLRVEALVDPVATASEVVSPYRHEMWFRFDELGLDLAEASVVTPSLDGPVVALTEPVRDAEGVALDVGGVPREARRWLIVTLLVLVAASVTSWPTAAGRSRRHAGHGGAPGHAVEQPASPVPPRPAVTRVASVELPTAPLRVRLSSRADLDEFAHRTGSSVLVRDDGWAAVVTDGAVHWWEPETIPARPPRWADGPDVSAPAASADPVRQLEARSSVPRRPLFAPRSPAAHTVPTATALSVRTVHSTIDEIVAYLAEIPESPRSSDPSVRTRPASSLDHGTRRGA